MPGRAPGADEVSGNYGLAVPGLKRVKGAESDRDSERGERDFRAELPAGHQFRECVPRRRLSVGDEGYGIRLYLFDRRRG